MDVLRFAILGIGAGAAYVLIAQGIVLIYRGSGVLNFAQGGIAMIGAQMFFSLRDNHGVPVALAFVASILVCAAIGTAMQLLVLRRLRRASALVRLVSTLALLALVQGVGALIWDPDGGDRSRPVRGMLPSSAVSLGHGIAVGRDRIGLAIIAVLLTILLWAVYSRSRYGLATSAVAENQNALVALGWSADLIGAANWALGGGLAAVAGILLSPIAGLSVTALVLTVIPGLAAALVGRFSSFGLTLVAGFGIAAIQSVMARYVATPGWADSVPFLVIIAFVMVRGRALPLRGDLLDRPVRVGSGRMSATGIVVAVVGLSLIIPGLGGAWPTAFAVSGTAAMMALSVVLITGYAGQISLAQVTIAGVGALTAAWASSHGAPFLLAVLIAAGVAAGTGLVVALPALRCRGANLAVVTIGLSLCIESLVLTNPALTGGYNGYTLRSPEIFGWDISLLAHPERFDVVVSGALLISAVVVSNVRRGRTGRRLLAIRSNERAAAVTGINVLGAKLYVFCLGSAIAGAAGALAASMYPRVDLSKYTSLGSITLLLNVVIGGCGFIASSALAGVGAGGGVFPQALANLDSRWGSIVVLASGAGALLVLISHEHGIVDLWTVRLAALRARLPRTGRRVRAVPPRVGAAGPSRGQATSLRIDGLSVSFGPVTAVKDVSLTVQSGEVVGLIGPNGAGKTTLIDAACGLVNSRGSVALGPRQLGKLSVRARANAGLGRTFQGVELFDDMTVEENIASAAESRGIKSFLVDLVWPRRTAVPPIVSSAIEELELAPNLASYPDAMTTGTQRLVGIARSLANRPSILLMDEPTAGLDDDETAELGRLIRRIADEWGIGVLLVEHDINLVASICDRVVAMVQGEAVRDGTAAEVLTDVGVIEAYLGPGDPARGGASTAYPSTTVAT